MLKKIKKKSFIFLFLLFTFILLSINNVNAEITPPKFLYDGVNDIEIPSLYRNICFDGGATCFYTRFKYHRQDRQYDDTISYSKSQSEDLLPFDYKFNFRVLGMEQYDFYPINFEVAYPIKFKNQFTEHTQSNCELSYENAFLNLRIHTLWSIIVDYDYNSDYFEPIEWLSVQNTYNPLNFPEYSTKEKILEKDGKQYREIIFSYSFDADIDNSGIPGVYVIDNTRYCGAYGSIKFDFYDIFKDHNLPNLLLQKGTTYFQLNKIKMSNSYDDYYKITDYDRPDDLQDFEEVPTFDPPKSTGLDAIKEFFENLVEDFKNHIDNFINRLILAFTSLFVPNTDEIQLVYDYINYEITKQFGFLLYPIDLFKDILNRFLNLSASNIIINIPDIKVPNFDFTIIKATTLNITEILNNSTINKLWILYLDFVDVYLILGFLNLCWNKLNSFIGGMISENEYLTVEDSETYDNVTGEFKGSRRRISKSKRQRRKII